MEDEQRTVAASGGEGFRSRARGWFVSTGAPPAWPMVLYMVCGLVVGAAFTGLLPDFRATLLGALAGVVVAASGSAGPSGISRRVALVAAGVGFVLMAVAFVGGGLTSIGSILLAGAPTGDVTGWAGHRLLDTILGCAIAIAATYLLWPRDREAPDAVPVAAT